MSQLRLELMEHRGGLYLAIRGWMETKAYDAVKAIPGTRYSATHKCWLVPSSDEATGKLIRLLRCYHEVDLPSQLTSPLIQLPDGYHEHLVRVRYSEATIDTYESQLRQFIAWLQPRTLNDLNDRVIEEYLLFIADEKASSISTQNTAINAIKFYLEKVHRGERKVYYVDRPRKESKLPHVLTQDEVKALINVTKNVKHRCMLMVLYSTGVRMSELLRLRWRDFDESKLQVFVNGGKGRKDRMTITSKKAIEYIKYYMSLYKPRHYLFEGPSNGPYSPRSVNQVIHKSSDAANIRKRVSAHTLRHSFATHLLEDKVDIRYIQLLMGHESSKTTERYTHMTTKGFKHIKSPLDRLGMDFDLPSNSEE